MSNPQITPPRWADWLLEKLFHGEALEEVQGDLHESFLWRIEDLGPRCAKWHFIKEILQSIRLSNLKPYPFMQQFLTLFTSHIKTGWRFIWKTKGFSAINVLGLSIGIVFSWFAYQYAADQFSYNKHIQQVDHLYKMLMQANMMGNMIYFPGSSYRATQAIKDEVPEVVNVALFTEENKVIQVKSSAINQMVLSTNPQLLDYLNLDFLEGEAGVFESPRSALISERMAYKLGIRGEATSQFIQIQDSTGFTAYKILGVFRDIPENTSIKTDVFLPLSEFLNGKSERATSFTNFELSALLEFLPGTDVEIVLKKINDLLAREMEDDKFTADLSPLASFHLDNQPQLGNGFSAGGNKKLLGFIIMTGALCLIISIINYANFSISLYFHRAREVAVRKVMGANKSSVFQQLMTEALLTTLLAALLAVVLFVLIAPQFSAFVEKTFDFDSLIDQRFLPGNLVLILIIALVSGMYPAFLLSRFGVISSLKGAQNVGKGSTVMQSLLVVQFSISTAMIVCMLVFQGQVDMLVNRDRGHDVEDVIRINFPTGPLQMDRIQPFINEVRNLSLTEQITGTTGYNLHPYDDGENSFGLMNMAVDSVFMKTLGYRFVEGGPFSNFSDNSKEIIVNEAFLRKINVTDPIGKSIPFGQNSDESIIVGVIQDVISSAKSEPGALVYFPETHKRRINYVYLKTYQNQVALQKALEPIWKEFFFPYPLDYYYLEEEYNRRLDQEDKMAKISGLGSAVAIFIAAFGLLGLVGITIKQKLKQVSICRVLGAEKQEIAMMVSRKFLVPIFLSLLIGLSTSFMLTKNWLDHYTIRINLEWYYFFSAGVVVLGTMVLIVWVQVGDALKKNPIIYLKED